MHNRADVPLSENPREQVLVLYVPLVERHVVRHEAKAGHEAIEDSDWPSSILESQDCVAADIPGTAGNQDGEFGSHLFAHSTKAELCQMTLIIDLGMNHEWLITDFFWERLMRYGRAFLCLLAAQSVAFAYSAPVAAQEAVNDSRCYILSSIFIRAEDEKVRQQAAQAAFFYLGRVTGAPAEVEARLAAQAETISPQNSGPDMAACHQAMTRRANEVQGILNRLAKAQSR
jgi:hypothetical protein